MKGPIGVTTALRARAGCEADLEAALGALARAVREKEPGCLLFQPLRAQHEPRSYLVLERYRDEQALADHANAEHFREPLHELIALLEAPPDLTLYEELQDPREGGPLPG